MKTKTQTAIDHDTSKSTSEQFKSSGLSKVRSSIFDLMLKKDPSCLKLNITKIKNNSAKNVWDNFHSQWNKRLIVGEQPALKHKAW